MRSQVARLQADLSEARKLGLESQSKLKVELDNSVRAHNSLRETYKSLSEQEQASQARLAKAEGDLSDLQKAKRSLESKLQSVRSRQIDADSHLGEAIRAKEVSLEVRCIQLNSHDYCRDWSVNSFMRKRNARTSKTRGCSWNERNQHTIGS